ncbi:MAG: class I SAM-dependent methyltransferase [Acidobacteria bacterium]|nr:MAG: class I SAM-dependent methyltransferase [Acidobacteriota bacterium]
MAGCRGRIVPGAGMQYSDWATPDGKVCMSGLTEVNSVETPMAQYQKAVDSFFRHRSLYWKDVYDADSLSAVIYRERRSTVLSMVDNLKLPVYSSILEAGCGAGSISVAMAKRSYRVNAVDTVEGMLELTRQAADEAGLGPNIGVSSADVCQLSFPSQHFTVVLAVGVLAWLDHPRKAIAELYRVTKSGGYVILTATNKWCLDQILDPLCFPGLRPLRWQVAEVLERFNIWRRSKPRQYRYSVKQIDALLSQAGFHKLAGRTLGFGPFTVLKQKLLPDRIGIKVHQKLQSLAGRQFPAIRSCGAVYVVLAQKP